MYIFVCKMNFDIKGDISCLLIETLCVTVFCLLKKKENKSANNLQGGERYKISNFFFPGKMAFDKVGKKLFFTSAFFPRPS